MSNIKRFSSRKDVIEFLKEKGIDTSNWSEEKWLSLNKGQAEIHMMALAEAMWDAYNESIPNELKSGEWHVPFKPDFDSLQDFLIANNGNVDQGGFDLNYEDAARMISIARCARVSYTVVGESRESNYESDIKLYNKLLESGHMSPFEHCARVMSDEEYISFVKGNILKDNKGSNICGWCDNFKGFIQYRYLIEQ